MEIPEINLNHLKVFVAVYESRSMTVAAERLHLTQSGVSQHIKAFESDLGVLLFTRVGRRLVPTALAAEVYTDLESALANISARFTKLKEKDREPEGIVRIGMPIEFGNNIIVPQLARIGQKYRKITFEITLDYASVLHQLLLNGELDFAYVDETPPDRRLSYEPVASEELLLCASRKYVDKQPKVKYSSRYFEALDYVEYKGSEPILRRWMRHHLKRKNLNLNVRAHIMDVQGVAKFITCDLGVGVLPDHVVNKMRSAGTDLYVYEGKNKPLKNEIRLTKLKNYNLHSTARVTLNELTGR